MADQKGMAAVIALLILALLSLLGITLMGLSLTESQIGSNEADLKRAFFAAEAGIQEALYRMRLDPNAFSYEGANPGVPCTAAADPLVIGFVQGAAPNASLTVPSLSSGIANNWNYNPFATPACSWTYSGNSATGYGNYFGGNPGTPPGDLDSAGRTFRFCAAGDTSAYCTSANYAHKIGNQLANANIINTASDPGSYMVTVAPVVGYVGGCWQYVNQFGTPLPLKGSAIACDPGAIPKTPMYKVTSIGTAKTSQKVLSTMIQHYSIDPHLDGAVTANSNVTITSAADRIDARDHTCDGNLHSPSGPHGTLKAVSVPIGDTVTVNKDANIQCSLTGTDTVSGVANCAGTSTPFPSTIGAFLLGPTAAIEEINAFNDYLESIKVAPPGPTSAFHGVVYVDGDYAALPDGSTGVLIVHNATSTATLGPYNGGTFKGLVIADVLQINGNAEIIGAVVTFAGVTAGEGNPSIIYSKCVMEGLAQNFMLHAVKGTWHEQ
jgi:Tfp pilus assembly protein PilX